MQIDIRKIPVYFINLNTEEQRRKQTEQVLFSLGFESITRIPGEVHTDPKVGCALSHYKVLSNKNIKTPFILLEDDIVYNNSQKFIYDIPDNVDSLYIGASQWARYLNFSGPYLQYKRITNEIVRIFNMLTAHGVIHFNDGYREHLSRIAYHASHEEFYHMDVGYAETQKYYNVYALDLPFFAQMGYNYPVTSKRISEMGMDYEESKLDFETSKWNLLRLAGIPDLKGSGGYYDPRWWH